MPCATRLVADQPVTRTPAHHPTSPGPRRHARLAAIPILMIAAALLVPSLLIAATAPAVGGLSASTYVLVKGNADHTGATALDQSTLAGNVYVFVPSVTGMTRVAFYLDGALRHTENVTPWDFAGTDSSNLGLPFDTRSIANGSHTFRADVTSSTGSVTTLYATAYVSNSTAAAAATATPKPTATPTPLSGIAVPSSIDSSGATDVTSALQSFVNGVPGGSTIVFRSGGIYQVNGGLSLSGRSNLVLEGNGATLRQAGYSQPIVKLYGASYITVRDLTILGNNADAGTAAAYHPNGQEFAHGISIRGSSHIEVGPAVTISRTWGDSVFIGSWTSYADWADTVWVHDSTLQLNGRVGVVVNAGRNVTVERDTINATAMHVFDIEPDDPAEGATNVVFRNNTIGSYGLTSMYASFLLAAVGNGGSTVSGITMSGNSVAGNTAGYAGTQLGLETYVKSGAVRRKNIVVTNNTCNRPSGPQYPGAVLSFVSIDGLTVTGNVQPLSSQPLLYVSSDSTGVTKQ